MFDVIDNKQTNYYENKRKVATEQGKKRDTDIELVAKLPERSLRTRKQLSETMWNWRAG